MKRKIAPIIPDAVQTIRQKLDTDASGATLTRAERKHEVSRDEAAYLLSARARREISADYIKQLTRTDKGEPRLVPARAIGNTYLFTVESLLGIRFIKVHEKEE